MHIRHLSVITAAEKSLSFYLLIQGAGIVTSRALTATLSPRLAPYAQSVRSSGSPNDRLHDVAFVRLLAAVHKQQQGAAHNRNTKKQGPVLLTHVDGFFSQTPGFYLSEAGKQDVPRGLPLLPATYHYLKHDYLRFFDFVSSRVCLHCRGGTNATASAAALPLLAEGLRRVHVTVMKSAKSPTTATATATKNMPRHSRQGRGAAPKAIRVESIVGSTWGQFLDHAVLPMVPSLPSLFLPRGKYDWFVLVGELTYVVPSNLVLALAGHDPSRPLLLTCGAAVALRSSSSSSSASSSATASLSPTAFVKKLNPTEALSCGMVLSRGLVARLSNDIFESSSGSSSNSSSSSSSSSSNSNRRASVKAGPQQRQGTGRDPSSGHSGLATALLRALQSVSGDLIVDEALVSMAEVLLPAAPPPTATAATRQGSSDPRGSVQRPGRTQQGGQVAAATIPCGVEVTEKQRANDAGSLQLRTVHFALRATRARLLLRLGRRVGGGVVGVGKEGEVPY